MRWLRSLCLLLPLAAWSADFPFAGNWKINTEKSTFSIGEPPRSLKITLSAADGGFAYSSENLDNPAKPGGVKYTAKFDADDVVLPPGDRGYDRLEVKRIDERSFRVRSKLGAIVVGETTYTLSKDGNTMIRTGHFKKGNADNQYRETFDRVR